MLEHFLAVARTVILRHWHLTTALRITKWVEAMNQISTMEQTLARTSSQVDACAYAWAVLLEFICFADFQMLPQ